MALDGNAKGLMDLHSRWIWDADVMRCRDCGRGLHVSRQGETLHHAAHCKHHGSTENPWRQIRFFIGFVGEFETSDTGDTKND